jgi:hypothetical protein
MYEAVVELANETECSQADVVRDALSRYFEEDRDDDLRDTLLRRLEREKIIDEGREESREASFKSTVAGRLHKHFKPEPRRKEPHDVRKDMASFRREAEEVYVRQDLIEFVDVTVDAYARAYDESDRRILELATMNPDNYLSEYGVYEGPEGYDETDGTEGTDGTEEPDRTETTDGGRDGTGGTDRTEGTETTDETAGEDRPTHPSDRCDDCTGIAACERCYELVQTAQEDGLDALDLRDRRLMTDGGRVQTEPDRDDVMRAVVDQLGDDETERDVFGVVPTGRDDDAPVWYYLVVRVSPHPDDDGVTMLKETYFQYSRDDDRPTTFLGNGVTRRLSDGLAEDLRTVYGAVSNLSDAREDADTDPLRTPSVRWYGE